jgi:hypothetical protein
MFKTIRQDVEGIAKAWKLGEVMQVSVSESEVFKDENSKFRQVDFITVKGKYKLMI